MCTSTNQNERESTFRFGSFPVFAQVPRNDCHSFQSRAIGPARALRCAVNIAASMAGNIGTLAALTGAAPAPSAPPSSTPFVSLLHLLTRPETSVSSNSASAAGDDASESASPYTSASPGNIADALIRAMLGGGGSSAETSGLEAISGSALAVTSSVPVPAPTMAAGFPVANSPAFSGSAGTSDEASEQNPAASANTVAAPVAIPAVVNDARAVNITALNDADANNTAVNNAPADNNVPTAAAARGSSRKPKAAAASSAMAGASNFGGLLPAFPNPAADTTTAGANPAASSDASASDAMRSRDTAITPNPLTTPSNNIPIVRTNSTSAPLAFGANLTPKPTDPGGQRRATVAKRLFRTGRAVRRRGRKLPRGEAARTGGPAAKR